MWVDQDHLDFKASEVLQAEQDPEELEDHQENLENQDRTERMESLVLKAFKACLGQWGHLETKDQWGSRVGRVILVCLGSKVLEVIQARMAHLEALDHLDLLDQLEKEELQAVLVPVAFRGCRDHLAKMALLAKMEQQDCRDLQV
jgi:hypothetical protein